MNRLHPSPRPPGRRAQRGAVLIVGLVMLLLITLGAVAAVRMSTTHVQVTANEQFRTEAAAVANYALDLAVNNPNFTDAARLSTPGALSLQQAGTGAEGAALSATYIEPTCLRYRYLKNSELVRKDEHGNDVPREEGDAACLRGVLSSGITIVDNDAAGADDNSLCVATLWEVGATVEDPQTGAAVTVNQGIEVRMEINDAENKCR